MFANIYLFYLIMMLVALLKRESKTIFIALSFFTLLLIIFKDGSVLPDYKVYNDIFDQSSWLNSPIPIEPTYTILSNTFKLIGLDYFYLLALYAFLTVLLFARAISFQNNKPIVTLFFFSANFLILYGLIQIRNGLALAIIYFSLVYYKGISLKVLLVASLFHVSVLVTVVLIYIAKYVSKNVLLMLAILTWLLFATNYKLISPFLEMLPDMGYVSAKLIGYALEERSVKYALNPIGFMVLYRLASSIVFCILIRDSHLLRIYLLGTVSYFALREIPEVAVRISNSLFLVEIFLLTRIYEFRWARAFVVTLGLTVGIVNVIFSNAFAYG